MDVDVKHLPDRSRFEAQAEGLTAYLTYEKEGGTVTMTHTIVPPPIEGRGIAGELTRVATQERLTGRAARPAARMAG